MKPRSKMMLGCMTMAMGVLFLTTALKAHAHMVLALDDPSTVGVDVIIIDNMAAGIATTKGNSATADGSGNVGQILFNGSLGGTVWSVVNVTTGISKPLIGPGQLDLNSINISSLGAGTLNLFLTDTDYLTPGTSMISAIGGTAAHALTAQQTLNCGNHEFAIGDGTNFVTPLQTFGAGAFSSTTSVGGINCADAYSVTESVTITHSGPSQVTSFDYTSSVVPEARSSLLRGICLVSLLGAVGMSNARKRTRAA